MKRIPLLILSLLAVMTISAATATNTSSPSTPDFAFPQNVSSNAEKNLKASLAAGNDIATIRSFIDLSLAQGMIEENNLQPIYARIDTIMPQMATSAGRSVMSLLRAVILNDIYGRYKYKFDDRNLPLTPFPTDWNEWSGDQFRNQIERNIDLALADREALIAEPSSRYSTIFLLDRQSEIYYPTLYDVIATRAIDILQSNFPIPSNLPQSVYNVFCTSDSPITVNNSPTAAKIIRLYSSLRTLNAANIAPYINNTLDCSGFIIDHTRANIINDDDDDEHDAMDDKFLGYLYNKYLPISQYSGDILLQMSADNFDGSNKKYYDALTQFKQRYPSYWRISCIERKIYQLKQASFATESPRYVAPNQPFQITLSNTNAKQVHISIYRLDDNREILASKTPLFHHLITSDLDVPFKVSDTITTQIAKPGRYIVMATTDGQTPTLDEVRNQYIMICTSVALGSISGDKYVVFSFNPSTGTPIPNVELFDSSEKRLRQTDDKASALLTFTNPKPRNITINPRLGDDIFGISTNLYLRRLNTDKTQISNNNLCDLPIYHPGDSIRWETIVFSNTATDQKPVGSLSLDAIMFNANHQPVDTATVTTDEFGRACGSFLIPEGDLTGDYMISFKPTKPFDKNLVNSLNALRFLVSDYKMPTFKVEVLNNAMDTPAKGDVTIKGRVMTLSGMPLSNTSVSLTLSVGPRSRYYGSSSDAAFYTDSITSGDSGIFEFTIPAKVLADSPYPNGRFIADITATSISSESQNTQTSFVVGAAYTIEASLVDSPYSDSSFEASKSIPVSVKVFDAYGKPIDMPVLLTITPSQKSLNSQPDMSIIINSDTKTIDLRKLTPGYYRFKFSSADPNLKSSTDSIAEEYTIFRINDSHSPSTKAVWGCSSTNNQSLTRGEKAKIIYAVPTNDSYLFYVLSSGDNILDTKWIKAKSGVHTLEVALPDSISLARVALYGCRDFSSASFIEDLSITKEKINIQCESFRDNLLPGSTEQWRFKVVDNFGNPVKAAMTLGMYNAALEKFRTLTWPGSFAPLPRINPNTSFYIYSRKYYKYTSVLPLKPQYFDCPSLGDPAFNTYGYSFSRLGVTTRMVKNMSITTARGMMSTDMLSGGVDNIDAEVSNVVLEEASAAEYKTLSAPLNEYVVVNGLSANDNGNSKNNDSAVNFEYRDGATTLAFFRPALTTDADGTLSFNFTVPNANTTWRLNALAFTDKMISSSLTRTFLANKPVMVTPNLPRFLRSGDRAAISSLILNNSSEAQIVTTTVEIFNPLTVEVVDTKSVTDTIPAHLNRTITTIVNVPVDATSIGYRVKSATADYADGEQSLIPVLPNADPVIETTPFYISPDSAHFAITLPEVGSDARVTLQYCDNPTWYVVTALPGLRKGRITTPAGAADAIFSAAVAEGLLRDFPQIDEALSHWTQSDRSDSTLVSMLQRNSDLKTMLLQATPWVVDAMTDTQRMERLSLLLDRSNIRSIYAEATGLLSRLQRADGGWAWMSHIDEPSLWATTEALTILGRLNRLNYLPSDRTFNQSIEKALKWQEQQIEKQYRKYPKSGYLQFATLRDLWPQYKTSLTGQTIIKAEVQKIVRDWRKYDVATKATAATLLNNNGYRPLARTILTSLYQFAKTSPTQGMWWPSVGEDYGGSMAQLLVSANILMAINQITPGDSRIDAIRQWLILQKEARNWGSDNVASEVICAILASSSKWVTAATPAAITIDGHALAVDYTDATLGYLRTDISRLATAGAVLTVDKSSLSPSWGAVYAQSVKPMTTINASSCEAVSIEKRLYRQQGTSWVACDSATVGDRIKIQLLIHANRDMQYMAITDNRAACLEPVDQLPGYIYSEGLRFYRENRDSATNLFVTNMPRGTYMLEYEMWVNNAGDFASGIATIQSQYAPQLTAHSGGSLLRIANK